MLVPRAVAVRDDETAAAPHVCDHPVERSFRFGSRLDERLDAEVVAFRRLCEQLVDRPFRLELRLLAGGEHLVRLVLRRLHIRLVEWIDLEVRAGDGDRELPAEELGAQRIRVG